MTDTAADRWTLPAAKVVVALMFAAVVVIVAMNARLMGHDAQKITNTNLVAPFSAVGFLTAMAGLVFAIAVTLWAVIARRHAVLRAIALAAVSGVALYAALLVGYSAGSREVSLKNGEEKYFCELDCHLAYAVTGVKQEGAVMIVELRTRFDETTIAPWRGNGTLAPNPRRVEVIDASGRIILGREAGGTDPRTPLRPGESYTTEFTFQLPQGARDLRLLVADDNDFPERVLIGNENSFLHRKIYFRL